MICPLCQKRELYQWETTKGCTDCGSHIAYSNGGISDLSLSVRPYNALINNGVWTVKELSSLSARELMRFKNIGKVSVGEIMAELRSYRDRMPPLDVLEVDA